MNNGLVCGGSGMALAVPAKQRSMIMQLVVSSMINEKAAKQGPTTDWTP